VTPARRIQLDLEAAESVWDPRIPALGAVSRPLGSLSGGKGAGERVVERVQDWAQAARSVLQVFTRRCAGDRQCGLARTVGVFSRPPCSWLSA